MKFIFMIIYILSVLSLALLFIQHKHDHKYIGINHSIAYDDDTLWGMIRITNDHKCPGFRILTQYRSHLQTFILSHAMSVIFKKSFVENIDALCQHETFSRQGFEDPRVFMYKNERFAIANGVGLTPNPCRNKMLLLNLHSHSVEILKSNIKDDVIQKNWSPFIHNEELHFEYSINPHLILKYDTTTRLIANSSCPNLRLNVHGGTQAILINDRFVAIAHSFPHYKNIAYSFSNTYPFKLLSFSDEFYLEHIGSQFASGLALMPDKNTVIVSYTVNDCETYFKKLKVNTILSLLVHKCS